LGKFNQIGGLNVYKRQYSVKRQDSGIETQGDVGVPGIYGSDVRKENIVDTK